MINNAYKINVIEYRRDNHKMDNPEKMATQDTNKQTKSQHNMCWTSLYANKHKSNGTQNVKTHNTINRTTQKRPKKMNNLI